MPLQEAHPLVSTFPSESQAGRLVEVEAKISGCRPCSVVTGKLCDDVSTSTPSKVVNYTT